MKIAGTILIVLALVIGIVPQFTDCQSQGRAIELANGNTIPMKCHWTARAEIPLGFSLLVIGLMTIKNRGKTLLRSLAVLGAIIGIFTLLVPTQLIGVCMGNEMLCNIAMKPTLILSGILTTLVSIAIFVLASRNSPAEIPPVAQAQV